jgi:hypothetical protein
LEITPQKVIFGDQRRGSGSTHPVDFNTFLDFLLRFLLNIPLKALGSMLAL